MNANLYCIEQTLEDLMDQGAQAELDGDHEAAAVFYQQLQEYLTREAAKVTSYVGLIRSREATVAAAKLERDRIDGIMKRAQADVDRMKATALAVMQRFGVRELKANPGGGLRVQGNGGVEPLSIPQWPKDSAGNWKPLPVAEAPIVFIKTYALPDTERIRAALKSGEKMSGSDEVKLLERGEHVRVI